MPFTWFRRTFGGKDEKNKKKNKKQTINPPSPVPDLEPTPTPGATPTRTAPATQDASHRQVYSVSTSHMYAGLAPESSHSQHQTQNTTAQPSTQAADTKLEPISHNLPVSGTDQNLPQELTPSRPYPLVEVDSYPLPFLTSHKAGPSHNTGPSGNAGSHNAVPSHNDPSSHNIFPSHTSFPPRNAVPSHKRVASTPLSSQRATFSHHATSRNRRSWGWKEEMDINDFLRDDGIYESTVREQKKKKEEEKSRDQKKEEKHRQEKQKEEKSKQEKNEKDEEHKQANDDEEVDEFTRLLMVKPCEDNPTFRDELDRRQTARFEKLMGAQPDNEPSKAPVDAHSREHSGVDTVTEGVTRSNSRSSFSWAQKFITRSLSERKPNNAGPPTAWRNGSVKRVFNSLRRTNSATAADRVRISKSANQPAPRYPPSDFYNDPSIFERDYPAPLPPHQRRTSQQGRNPQNKLYERGASRSEPNWSTPPLLPPPPQLSPILLPPYLLQLPSTRLPPATSAQPPSRPSAGAQAARAPYARPAAVSQAPARGPSQSQRTRAAYPQPARVSRPPARKPSQGKPRQPSPAPCPPPAAIALPPTRLSTQSQYAHPPYPRPPPPSVVVASPPTRPSVPARASQPPYAQHSYPPPLPPPAVIAAPPLHFVRYAQARYAQVPYPPSQTSSSLSTQSDLPFRNAETLLERAGTPQETLYIRRGRTFNSRMQILRAEERRAFTLACLNENMADSRSAGAETPRPEMEQEDTSESEDFTTPPESPSRPPPPSSEQIPAISYNNQGEILLLPTTYVSPRLTNALYDSLAATANQALGYDPVTLHFTNFDWAHSSNSASDQDAQAGASQRASVRSTGSSVAGGAGNTSGYATLFCYGSVNSRGMPIHVALDSPPR